MFAKKFFNKMIFAVLAAFFGLFFFLETKAADPIKLDYVYEIAEGIGSNLDSDVDQSGNTFVIYEKSGKIYLVKNRESEVLVGTGSNPSIALDNTGSPHVAYINSGLVIYETFDGDWDNEEIVPVGTSASATNIDVDSNGKTHIVARAKYYNDGYCDPITDIVYFSNVSGSFALVRGWNGQVCYDNPDRHYYDTHPISIKIDDSDNYHILFWHKNIYKTTWSADTSYDLQYHTSISGASATLGGSYALYKNSLTVDAFGRAHVVYGGVKHGLVSGGTWTSSDLVVGSSPAIFASNSSVAIAYANSDIYYSENFGEGFSAPIVVGSLGSNPSVTTNGTNRFVYYIKDTKIYLSTDKAIYNAPVISGVEEGGIYNTSKTVTWDNGLGSINGMPAISGATVTMDGSYEVTVINAEGKTTTVSFSIDQTPPTITILPYNIVLTNQDVTVSANTNEGTLNFVSHIFTQNDSFDFEATDQAGNKTTSTVVITNIDKTPPKITFSTYETAPTNQDITVNATANEGDLDTASHTFSENGSFTFIATDEAGNTAQEIISITNIDRLAPTITLSDYTKNPTNLDITINATTDEGSLNSSSQTFTENGSFEFVATDEAGNATSRTVTIDNIDKIMPSNVSITSPLPFTFVKQTIALQAEAQDSESGIAKVEFYSTELGKITEDNLAPYVADWNSSLVADGSYHLYAVVYDKAGNTKTSETVITSVDNTQPVITIIPYTTDPTNEDIIVTANSNEGGLNQGSYTFTSNGTFEFVAIDLAGNVTKRTIVINNIDKEGPELTIDPYILTPTNQDITVQASVTEGVLNFSSHTFTSNGEFEFIASDPLGNQTRQIIKITNIDKKIPNGSIIDLEAGSYMRSLVSLVSNGEDDGLGIDRVEFYHASIPTLIGTDYFAPYIVDWDTSKVDDGVHQIWSVIYDKAGNKTTTSEIEINVDNTAPIITINDYPTEPTTESITINASVNEGTLNSSSYTFTKNGSFDFMATDQAGNKTVKNVTINNIYVAQPTEQSVLPVKDEENGSSESQSSTEVVRQGNVEVTEVTNQDEKIIDKSSEVQILNPAIEDTSDEKLVSEPMPIVKGDTTENPINGWWRWTYLLGLIVIAGFAYIFIKNKKK